MTWGMPNTSGRMQSMMPSQNMGGGSFGQYDPNNNMAGARKVMGGGNQNSANWGMGGRRNPGNFGGGMMSGRNTGWSPQPGANTVYPGMGFPGKQDPFGPGGSLDPNQSQGPMSQEQMRQMHDQWTGGVTGKGANPVRNRGGQWVWQDMKNLRQGPGNPFPDQFGGDNQGPYIGEIPPDQFNEWMKRMGFGDPSTWQHLMGSPDDGRIHDMGPNHIPGHNPMQGPSMNLQGMMRSLQPSRPPGSLDMRDSFFQNERRVPFGGGMMNQGGGGMQRPAMPGPQGMGGFANGQYLPTYNVPYGGVSM